MIEDLDIEILSLHDYSNIPDVVEDGHSFFENALKKAQIISEYTGEIVLSDDSGLEVDYLDGKPGVYSSRYSGENATDDANIKKLLHRLEGVPVEQRSASFICILVLYLPEGRYRDFEGRLQGLISDCPAGDGGFGYDPVFFLPDRGLTVAQLPLDIKNKISHRARAIEKFKEAYKQGIF